MLLTVSTAVSAAEIIKIYSPYGAAHSGTPALLKVVDQANASQDKFQFLVEFRPGANQLIAIKAIQPENSLAIIAPAFVDHINSGVIDQNDYVPVHALGDACWAVVTNKPLSGAGEFTVGGVGFGNAAHLTALALGQKYNFDVRYIVFKSNAEALVNMAGDHGVEFVIDKYENYEALKIKNPKMNMVAASCPTRLPQAPDVPTLREHGIDAPYIFNITVAHRQMPATKRQEISNILNIATLHVGQDQIFKLSAMRPPIFINVDVGNFYRKSVDTVSNLQKKHRSKLKND